MPNIKTHSILPRTIFILLGLFGYLSIFSQTLELESITVNDGLPQGLVLSPLQSQDGFIWLSTNAGLCRYDGVHFVEFLHDPFNPFSPAQNATGQLFEDSRGRMWIKYRGSNGNIDIYDPESGRFFHTQCSLPEFSNNDNVFCEDPSGALWHGNVRIDLGSLELNESTPPDISVQHESIPFGRGQEKNKGLYLYLTKDSTLYFLTTLGLYEINWRVKKITEIDLFDDLKNGNTEHPIRRRLGATIFEDRTGQIWVSMDKIYYLENGSLVPAPFPKEQKGNLFELNGWMYSGINQLNRFSPDKMGTADWPIISLTETEEKSRFLYYQPYTDRSGVIWLGTNGHGIRRLNPFKKKFEHYLSGQSSRSIFLDKDGQVWLQDAGSAFHQVDLPTGKWFNSIGQSGFAVDLMQDKNGNMWVSGGRLSRENGRYLLRVDAATGDHKWYDSKVSLVSVNVLRSQRSILENGKIWLLGNDSLACFSIENEQFEYWSLHQLKNQGQQAGLSFQVFIKTGEREFWAGAPLGLFQIKLGEKPGEIESRLFQSEPENIHSLSLNHIYSLCPDPAEPERFLWVGTNGNGLNRLDKKTGEFEHFTTKDGLPNGVIYGILPGTRNDLWMSTNFGLSNFNPATGLFTNFTAEDGLQSNEFNATAAFRAEDGTLLFGGVNGLNIFHPDSLRLNDHVPQIVITSLTVNNEKVDYRNSFLGKKSAIVSKPINRLKSVELAHFQDVIGIEYAALDFVNPSQNRYRHQLVGVDEAWVEAGHETRVQYAHLPPGEYLFKVIGSNNDGVWNEVPATLEITILPPWWKTKWAYAAYFLMLFGGMIWLYNFQIKRIKERSQLAFEKKETERLAELDRIKTDFFSNVTHEFRTPLTLILEPVRQLLKTDLDGKIRAQLSLVENNAEKLLALVNQLLDMAKMEDGKMELDLRKGDVMECILPIFQSFHVLAERKGISLKMNGLRVVNGFYFDKIKVEKVLMNLLSNAVKFTSVGSVQLTVSTRVDEVENISGFENLGCLTLTVTDTGTGIQTEALPHIFDRFYQVDGTSTRAGEGTGIGLALAKELVELMGGTIFVESEVGKGSTFTVTLPMKNSVSEKLETKNVDAVKMETKTEASPIVAVEKQKTSMPILGREDHLILLIEDNPELRQFTKSILDSRCQVVEASNGAEGIRKAKELVPDLIISDVMMPEKNGFEVCDELKSDWLTSHVPIVLLTAKSAIDSRIKGFKTGADAYLTKPFHSEELLVRVEKLIEGRRHLQEKFAQSQPRQSIKKTVAELPRIENEFLRKLTLLVEENMDNEKFSVEALAENSFLSRSQLFRKLKAITGQSPNEFIRNYRLDRAMDLLKNKEGTIGQIASMVGFGDEKYFSTRFKKRFGQSPSEV